MRGGRVCHKLGGTAVHVLVVHGHAAAGDAGDTNARGPYTPLMECGDEQRRRRLKPTIDALTAEAQHQKCSLNELLACILKQSNYVNNREVASLSEKIINNESAVNKLSLDTSTYLKQSMFVGKKSYRVLNKTLKNNKTNTPLQSWESVRDHEKSFTPPVKFDTLKLKGVRFEYPVALKLHLKRLLDSLPEDQKPDNHILHAEVKDGFDGSGNHPIYQQAGNEESSSIISYYYCLLDLKEADTNKIIFKERCPSSPHAMRPIHLLLGKEATENLEEARRATAEREDIWIEVESGGVLYRILIKGM